MKKLLSFILELLRMIVLLILFLFAAGWMERSIYQLLVEWQEMYQPFLTIGNVILFFVLYRNYLQHKGWYKSPRNYKLGRELSIFLTGIALLLWLSPLAFAFEKHRPARFQFNPVLNGRETK